MIKQNILPVLLLALFVAGSAGCTAGERPRASLPTPEQVLPSAEAVAGWTRIGEPATYDTETLYDFMDGAADLYFAYGFERLAVGDYEHSTGGRLRIEVYRTATDADAYGLFTLNRYGEPIDVGVDGMGQSGTGLTFWAQRTFVHLTTRDPIDDAALRALAEAAAAALPADGQRPALVDALPDEGLHPESVRFYRVQMALENFIWLGPENVLDLDPSVEGVLAEYTTDGAAAQLLLLRYPDAERAARAVATLRGAGIEGLVTAEVRGPALCAVLGSADSVAAGRLVQAALDGFD